MRTAVSGEAVCAVCDRELAARLRFLLIGLWGVPVRKGTAMSSSTFSRHRWTDAAALREHLRDHLTDGAWHDRCPYCLHRRRHGGNGVPDEVAAAVATAASGESTETTT